MTELVEFLRARLDEDEQAAKHVRQPYRLYVDDGGRVSEPKRVDDLYGERDGEYEQWADGEDRLPNHIATWWLIYAPARVLREVEAKRLIIERYEQQAAKASENAMEEDRVWTLEPILLDLALPYADHPDYRGEWRPSTPERG